METNRDITERKRAEEALRGSEASLSAAQRIAHLGSWELDLSDLDDLNRNALRWSDECFRIFGYVPGEVEVTNDLFFEAVHPDDHAAIMEAVTAAIRERATYSIEHRLILRDGSERVVHEHGDVVCDESGRLLRLVGTVQDITERKRAEETLRENFVLLNSVIEGTSDPIFVKDTRSRFLMLNSACAKVIGGAAEEILGKDDTEFFPPEAARELIERDREVMATGESYTFEEEVPVEGVMRTFLSTKMPYWNHRGEMASTIGVSHDITERKETEEALREVREAERKRMARDLHDGALQDLTYALAETEIVRVISKNPVLKEWLERVVEALRRTGQEVRVAVHDLRLEGELHRPFPELLEPLLSMYSRMIRDCDVCLEVEQAFPSVPLGRAGAELLRVVQEALNNVRKHARARNVLVKLGIEGDEIWAEVSDDGLGFDSSAARVGTGLKSMRERVTALGGELRVESEPGKGTNVSFSASLRAVTGTGGRR